MSFPTQPAFAVHAKGWDDKLLAHPMGRFLHEHEKLFDLKDFEACKIMYAPDVVYTKANGMTLAGDAAIQGLLDDYALFAEYFHEPVYGTIFEEGDGYRLIGTAKMFVNLPVPGEKKFKDLSGRSWECQAQGAFIFNVVRDSSSPHGFKFTYWQTFADPTPILAEAIKRGVIPVEAITSGGAA